MTTRQLINLLERIESHHGGELKVVVRYWDSVLSLTRYELHDRLFANAETAALIDDEKVQLIITMPANNL